MTASLNKTTDEVIFSFCGIDTLNHLFFGGISSSDDSIRKEMLKAVKTTLEKLF